MGKRVDLFEPQFRQFLILGYPVRGPASELVISLEHHIQGGQDVFRLARGARVGEGPLAGVLIGALFGIFGLIEANIASTGPGDPLFRDPLVSIFPRLFIGLTAYYVYVLAKRWNKIAALGGF